MRRGTRGLPLRVEPNNLPRMADETIRVEYNQALKPLEELLEGVERPGDFFVNGVVEIPMPKLEVEGVGVLSFPVPPAQIATLIQQATRAPYGRGEQTILDESVRKVWQLTPNQVRVGGRSWAASFDGILTQVVAGLGCEGLAVSAELYKLLVYDVGAFFLAHRDTEKADGMFATLIIALPSAHRGGALVIRHAGHAVTLEQSGAEISEVTFTAFYADCEHEVLPITEGNRVCLVYNLLQQRSAKGNGKSLHAPDYAKQIAAAAELLEKNLTGSGAPAKIAWLLEHQYSPEGLAFSALKSADAARVKVLAQAAEHAGCAAHLGIVHIEESGAAEEIDRDYRARGRRRYHSHAEDEAEYSSSNAFEVVEVSDSHHYVNQWRDLRDQPVEFGEIPLEPAELLPAGALDDEEPDEQRLLEASGNEGASFERSYHRAALVMWRRERYAEVLLQAGVAAVLPYFRERIHACEAQNAPPTARAAAVALARQLVTTWRDAPEYAGYRRPARPDRRDGMLSLLNQLGDAALLEAFIAEVVMRDYDGSENTALVAGARLLGTKTGPLYAQLIRLHLRYWHKHCADLLHALTFKSEVAADQAGQAALREIAEAVVSKLDEIGVKQARTERADWRVRENPLAVDVALVAKLLEVLGELDAPALRAAAVEKFAARPGVFDPITVLVPALALIGQRDDAVARLWKHSAEFILLRSERPPTAPRDWRQDAKLSCACVDCRELQVFTLDPVEQMHRFRVRLDRRQHLHQMIERHALDMTHATERKGSPQTLVCTKDRRSYHRRCDQYRKDIAALTSLAELAGKTNAAAALVEQIEAARVLAGQWSPA